MFPLLPQKVSTKDAEAFVDVGALQDLPMGGHITAVVGFMRVLVLRTEDDKLHAVADLCPHALQPLAGGEVRDGSIRCPKHGACFDLASGKPLNRVTQNPLTLYRVRVRDGRVELGVPAGKP